MARQVADFLRGRPGGVDVAMADELIAMPRVSEPAEI
jgi:hypothetical protein